MNRTIRNLVVAAPLATIALTLVPMGAATAGPHDQNFPIAIPEKPKGPKDIADAPKPKGPQGPKDIADAPKPKGPKDKAPKPAAKPQGGQQTVAAPAAVQAVEVEKAVAEVISAKGSPDSIDRSDALFADDAFEAELVVEETGGGALDLTWLLVGGGIVTASGIAFAARRRNHA